MNNGVGDCGSRRCLLAQEDAATMLFEHVCGRERKLFIKKSRVMRDDKRGGLFVRADMARNCRRGTAHAGEIEIVGDNAAPTGSAEMDGLAGHARLLYLGARTGST